MFNNGQALNTTKYPSRSVVNTGDSRLNSKPAGVKGIWHKSLFDDSPVKCPTPSPRLDLFIQIQGKGSSLGFRLSLPHLHRSSVPLLSHTYVVAPQDTAATLNALSNTITLKRLQGCFLFPFLPSERWWQQPGALQVHAHLGHVPALRDRGAVTAAAPGWESAVLTRRHLLNHWLCKTAVSFLF